MDPIIEKPIQKRKRQSCACDLCRKSKKKCDGKSPCGRCSLQNKICTYSPIKRRIRSTKTNKNNNNNLSIYKESKIENNLTTTVIGKKYLDIYCNDINPSLPLIKFDTSVFDKPKSKSILLQYNSILATSARVLGDTNLYHSFENRARQLACDLFDDLSLDSALGFYFYSMHLWGENDNKACHYRDITRSMCKRIVSQETDSTDAFQILYLELELLGINELHDISYDTNAIDDIITRLSKPLYSSPMAEQTLNLGRVQAKIVSLIFKKTSDPYYDINPFKQIDNNTCNILLDEIVRIELFFKQIFNDFTDIGIIFIAWFHFLRSVILYSVGNKPVALSYVKETIIVLESKNCLYVKVNPYFITSCHLMFLISYLEKEYLLANRISGFQRELTNKLPSGRKILEKEMELLKSIELNANSQTNSIKPEYISPFEFNPPPPLYTKTSNDNNNSNIIESNQVTPPIISDDTINIGNFNILNVLDSLDTENEIIDKMLAEINYNPPDTSFLSQLLS